MKVRFLASFDESVAALSAADQRKARRAVSRLLDHFGGGPRPVGLGLRQLRKPYWEVRASLDRRIVFSLEPGLVVFVLAGNHDEVRRFLTR